MRDRAGRAARTAHERTACHGGTETARHLVAAAPAETDTGSGNRVASDHAPCVWCDATLQNLVEMIQNKMKCPETATESSLDDTEQNEVP